MRVVSPLSLHCPRTHLAPPFPKSTAPGHHARPRVRRGGHHPGAGGVEQPAGPIPQRACAGVWARWEGCREQWDGACLHTRAWVDACARAHPLSSRDALQAHHQSATSDSAYEMMCLSWEQHQGSHPPTSSCSVPTSHRPQQLGDRATTDMLPQLLLLKKSPHHHHHRVTPRRCRRCLGLARCPTGSASSTQWMK